MDLKLSFEAAESITIDYLKWHRTVIQEDIDEYLKNPRSPENPSGKYLHPDDVVLYSKLVTSIDFLLENYFEGSVL